MFVEHIGHTGTVESLLELFKGFVIQMAKLRLIRSGAAQVILCVNPGRTRILQS